MSLQDTNGAGKAMPESPYGGGPSTGLQFPPYYQPTPSVRSRNNYFPGSETLGRDEMRISFVGSCPFPPRRDQAGTCIMVELGNGDRFFFDFGPGCIKNIIAMNVPLANINDIFITHLHVDHYHDLSYLLPFSAWAGRWKMPLRVTGPSGRTPELGTKAMVAGMKQMLKWHLEAFDSLPDRGRLRGRGQRVRLEGRERHLLRQERCHRPPLAALAHQGWRLGLPSGLERSIVRVDRRRPARRADSQVRQGRRCLCHRVAA